MAQKNISVGITAFLDILGFGDRVINVSSMKDIDAIAKKVRMIQSKFDHKPKDKLTKNVQISYKKTVLAFSDSVIVNVPFQSEMTTISGTFDPIIAELSVMACAQARCVTSEVFLRGGIDYGWWYRRGETLASQSMLGAYKMEGCANIPVIALTEKLYQFLCNHKDRQNYNTTCDPVKGLLRQYDKPCSEGRSSFWYLDYITLFADSIDWITSNEQYQTYRSSTSEEKQKIRNDGYTQNLTSWFNSHANSIKNSYNNAKTESVRNKYRWLAEYHNEIAKKFDLLSTCSCSL